MAADDDAEDVDEVLARLRARVAERSQSGEFPDDVEDALERQFERIVSHRPVPYDVERLRAAQARVEASARFDAGLIPTESGVPGGAALHQLVAKAVSRQTSGVLQQVAGFADAVRGLLSEVVEAVAAPDGHAHPGLIDQLDAALERLSLLERRPEAFVDTDVIARLVGTRAPVMEASRGSGIIGAAGVSVTRVDPGVDDVVARVEEVAPASLGAFVMDAGAIPGDVAPRLVDEVVGKLQPGGMLVALVASGAEPAPGGLTPGSIAGRLTDTGFSDVWVRRLVFSPFEHVVVAVR